MGFYLWNIFATFTSTPVSCTLCICELNGLWFYSSANLFEKEKVVSFLICHFILQRSLSLDTSFGHINCCDLNIRKWFYPLKLILELDIILKREKRNFLKWSLWVKSSELGPWIKFWWLYKKRETSHAGVWLQVHSTHDHPLMLNAAKELCYQKSICRHRPSTWTRTINQNTLVSNLPSLCCCASHSGKHTQASRV